jgi:hypothetical protein
MLHSERVIVFEGDMNRVDRLARHLITQARQPCLTRTMWPITPGIDSERLRRRRTREVPMHCW